MTKSWKNLERYVAKTINGRRIPVAESLQGRRDKGDVEHPFLFIECRKRETIKLPEWFRELSDKVKGSRKLPLLVISNSKLPCLVAVMRYQDLRKILKGEYKL